MTIPKLQMGKVFLVRRPHRPHNPRQILFSQSPSLCLPIPWGQEGQTSYLPHLPFGPWLQARL